MRFSGPPAIFAPFMSTITPPAPLFAKLARRWLLTPGVAFLNHGSFGAVPRATFWHQERWRKRVEAEPVEFLSRRYHELMEWSKTAVGRWLAMQNKDFALVANATEGVAAVLSSISLSDGDEIVTTNHVYNAVRQAMRYTARRWGATYREIDVPTPLATPEQIVERVMAGLSQRTKLLVLDHVTSPTALIFPVERIARECASRRVELLIDGAHAPGMVDLDVPRIGATWYTGNLHKWACCPRPAGFLWTRPDCQPQTHPAILSHHYEKDYATEFEWAGTRDPSSWLAAPSALRYMSRIGWERIQSHNRQMTLWARQLLARRWAVETVTSNDQMIGSMAALPLPGRLATLSEDQARRLQHDLYHRHQIEIPTVLWQARWHIRISCQVYNTPEDYERLAAAVAKLAQQ